MKTDIQPPQGSKTVLVDRYGRAPQQVALTDAEHAPRIENIGALRVFNARLAPDETISISLNPLVAAASDVLSFVVGIERNVQQHTRDTLSAHLTKAIKAFEATALRNGIESTQVMSARYVLCTVVDEAIATTAWGNESDWPQKSLLGSFHNETFGGTKVFQFIEQVSRDPVRNLYLLELLYVCLSLGFEGKFRIETRGALELDSIRDSLYRQIRHLRGDAIREVSPHWQGLGLRRNSVVRIVARWVLVALTLGWAGVMYAGFAWVLDEQREAVMQPYQQHAALVVRAAVVNRN